VVVLAHPPVIAGAADVVVVVLAHPPEIVDIGEVSGQQ